MNEKSLVKSNFIDYVDKIVLNNKVSHAYLIEVDNYDKDIKYIYNFIKMMLLKCSYKDAVNSMEKVSKLIDDNNYPDIVVVSSDSLTIKKEQIIDLEKEFNNKSLFDNKRIYIIKESEKLNASSANTILKFLEEPEDDIVAILLTDNRYHVIDTILSRCQVLSLKENFYDINFSDEIMDLLELFLSPKKYFINPKNVYTVYFTDKINSKELLNNISNILISSINYSILNEKNEYSDIFNNILKNNDINKLINILSILDDEIYKLNFNVNLKLWLDSLFCKLIGDQL